MSINECLRPTEIGALWTIPLNQNEAGDYAYIGTGDWKKVPVNGSARTGIRIQNNSGSADPQPLQVVIAPKGLYDDTDLPGASSTMGDANGGCVLFQIEVGVIAQIPCGEDSDVWVRSDSTDPVVTVQEVAGDVDLWMSPQPWNVASVRTTTIRDSDEIATLRVASNLTAANYPSNVANFACSLDTCASGVLTFQWTPSSALHSVLNVRIFQCDDTIDSNLMSDIPFASHSWMTLSTNTVTRSVVLPQGNYYVKMWAPYYTQNSLSVKVVRINN